MTAVASAPLPLRLPRRPYISLERIVEESRQTYYESLERSSRGWHQNRHEVHPWLGNFWGVLIRAYDEFEARVARH